MINVNEIWDKKEGRGVWSKDPNDVNKLYGEITEMGAIDIIDLFKPTKDDVIIDIGSGVGRLCAHLAVETDATVIGVELSEIRHREAVRMFGEYGLDNLRFIHGKYPISSIKKKPTMVIIHGCGFTRENAETIWESLPKGCKVIHNVHKTKIFDKLKDKQKIKIGVSYLKLSGGAFNYGIK